MKPLISQNLWPRKALNQISDPILKFVEDLHRDLELVYVGQVCLSWEILCWQHKKVKELQQYDSQWRRSYNLVAAEFQLFQVLMQRFLEDEPYQGPRIQNYNNNRCVIRNLLQVPPIKGNRKLNFNSNFTPFITNYWYRFMKKKIFLAYFLNLFIYFNCLYYYLRRHALLFKYITSTRDDM